MSTIAVSAASVLLTDWRRLRWMWRRGPKGGGGVGKGEGRREGEGEGKRRGRKILEEEGEKKLEEEEKGEE